MPRPDFSKTKDRIAEIIRVDHAGEYGARRIYEGQLKYTKNPEQKRLIKSMLSQELVHLDYFSKQLKQRAVRPTALMPLWNIGGYLLGSVSALMGARTAMLATKAVEEVIEEHYQSQIDYLKNNHEEEELLSNISQFQQDEVEHKHIATQHEAEQAYFAPIVSLIIKNFCRGAIYLSKKI